MRPGSRTASAGVAAAAKGCSGTVASIATPTELDWTSPDDGPWWFEAAHFPLPVSRLFAFVMDNLAKGWLDGAKAYGLPRQRARWAHVNGYLYYGERGETYDGDPELAERAVREQWWVREYERWFAEEKPAIEATNRAFQAVAVGSLDDGALRGHVRALFAHVLEVSPLHFAHRGRELSRDVLRRRAAEEGIELDLSAAIAGRSPASSRPAHLVAGIADALREDGVDPASIRTLAEIRAVGDTGRSSRAATLLDDYLGEFGWRLLDSYDLACPTLIERPEVVVASIRAAARGAGREARPHELSSMPDELRRLVEEAAVSAGTEDDDVGTCVFWPLGLLRRALLELARRRGVAEPAAIFELDGDELAAVLDGAGPADDELLARLRQRVAAAEVTPPPQLGGGDLPTGDLPATELTGAGVGVGVARGRACVVRGLDSDALGDIEPGDVLIALTTTPGYNAVMPIVSAVATETHLGHTIICARELDIPAVVGVRGLVDAVPHGAMVEVDAAAGVVRVIGDQHDQ